MPLRLVLAYDGSPAAANAVRAAAALFPAATASVVSVPASIAAGPGAANVAVATLSPTVVQETIDTLETEAQQQARATAEDGVERARASGLDAAVAPAPARSPAWETLLGVARELGAELLVCGTRGRGGFARTLLGSTSSSLLHHADLPLLVVPDGAGRLDGPAVVAYDGSETAQHAVEVAGRLLGTRRTFVVHVWESQYRHALTARALHRGPVDELHEIVDVLEQSLLDAAQAITHQGVAIAKAAGLDAAGETIESEDGAWRTVAAVARAHDAAVVVAGSRGLGGARSALLGSVSSGLVHNAELPTLIVPSRDSI